MPKPPKRALRDAHESIEALTREVASMLGVAALDVEDRYGDETLRDVFMKRTPDGPGSHADEPIARRFAEMLVARMLYADEIVLDWIDPDPIQDEGADR